MNEKLIRKLDKRKSEGTLRSLSCFDGYIDFYSNDYLGLSKIVIKVKEDSFGSTGSRLISGNSKAAETTETSIATLFNSEAALVFNSGYDANLGLFSSVPQRGDTILYDELIHASVRDGIRLSLASSYSFRHNSVEDLRVKISKAVGEIYVAVESLYSMDGDMAPLKDIAKLVDEFGANLIVDEAHSAGVFGPVGKGLIEEENLGDKVFARLITFGKAYGSHGAAIVGKQLLKDYLINFARPFIYTTALPSQAYERINEIINYSDLDMLRNKLNKNISYFRKELKTDKLISDITSPIQMIQIGNVERVKLIAEKMNDRKIAIKPIFSPTVQKGKESLRICIHADNTQEEIDLLINIIEENLL